MRCDLDVIVSLIIISDIEWGQSAGTNLSEGYSDNVDFCGLTFATHSENANRAARYDSEALM